MTPRRTIFLVDGASGTGKSDLVEYVNSQDRNIGIIRKWTTRPMRNHEQSKSLDLQFISTDDFEALRPDYRYEYGFCNYGFSKANLDALLCKCNIVFAIIRSIPVMAQVKEDYDVHNVVTVYVHSDLHLIKERIITNHGSPEDVTFRLLRVQYTYEDYVRHQNFYDKVIINNSDRDTFHKLINGLITKYTSDIEARQ